MSAKPTPPPPPACEVDVACGVCGKNHKLTVTHYSRWMICGRPFWALQPKRGGQLVMFPWPGHNLTSQELAEQESELDGTPCTGAQNI